jgi:glyceraldehyde 3-phosphate dehydrogenase
MKKTKIAINGFGRIGRLTLRNLLNNPNIEVVAINDLTDTKTLAQLFQYDSAHRQFPGMVEVNDFGLVINGILIKTFAIKDPTALPWAELGVDTVLECTGIFRDKEKASMHIQAGAKRVILSAPAKGPGVLTIVRGINDHLISSDDVIISNASCTTNCLAPLVKVILDNWGLEHAFMSTVHAYTGDQNLQDGPHKDLRRARAAAVNIVPTTTGAANALALVIPEIAGKINASSLRVPVITGSLVELLVVLEKPTDIAEANAVFKAAAEGHFKGIMQYSEAPLVSSDIISNPYSTIYDAGLTMVSGNILKVTAWYDNEAGYSARLAELAAMA